MIWVFNAPRVVFGLFEKPDIVSVFERFVFFDQVSWVQFAVWMAVWAQFADWFAGQHAVAQGSMQLQFGFGLVCSIQFGGRHAAAQGIMQLH